MGISSPQPTRPLGFGPVHLRSLTLKQPCPGLRALFSVSPPLEPFQLGFSEYADQSRTHSSRGDPQKRLVSTIQPPLQCHHLREDTTAPGPKLASATEELNFHWFDFNVCTFKWPYMASSYHGYHTGPIKPNQDDSVMAQSSDSGARRPGFQPQLGPRADSLTARCLGFLILYMGDTAVPIS